MDLDTSWCPVCSREIVPKRYQVPIAPTQPAAPAPPPSSPSSNNGEAAPAPRTTRTKSTTRAKGGLVHGTGRVKHNGVVKRTDSSTAVKAPVAAPVPTLPAAPIRHRTVIDQGPIPLYCSDECHLSDLNSMNGVVSLDYDPNREAAPTPAVPHNSYTNLGAVSGTESDSSSGDASSSDSSSWSSDVTKVSHVSPSMATLAALYNFPPMPAPAPIIDHSASQSSTGSSQHNFNEFHSGVMMAARRIRAALCPEVVKVNAFSTSTNATTSAARKPIPGWTDGTDEWRSTVYSLAAPNPCRIDSDRPRSQAHSISASPHHSRGVNSTVGEASTSTPSLPAPKPAPTRKTSEDLYSKYPLSFSRRADSRTSLYTAASNTSLPPSASSTSLRSSQRQKSLLKKGAEGKLLVPDVKLKARSPSLASFDSTSLASYRSGRSYPASPLSRQGSDVSEESTTSKRSHPTSLPPLARRPVTETRSWSYDNLMTYPVMPCATKKEKCIQRQVVDGVECDVEVVVEVPQPMKRLFLFADKDANR